MVGHCASIVVIAVLTVSSAALAQRYIGTLNSNPYDRNSVSDPYGAGSRYNRNGVNNPYGRYGSPYGRESSRNPYAKEAPKLYDRDGNYRGRLSTNPYDPESVSNPYGRYGSPYSRFSPNNPYGAGSPYAPSSPTNPYGSGLRIYAR
jgi:hypothetical protein